MNVIWLIINIIFVPVMWNFAMDSFENENYKQGYFSLFLSALNGTSAIYILSEMTF
jgi:hypothetical protein